MQVSTDLLRFNSLLNETDALYHDAAIKLGLSDSALRILYTLLLEPESPHLSQLARLNGMSRQTLNSSVRKLEAQGLIALEDGGGRRRYARLTADGLALAKKRVAPLAHLEESLLSAWPISARQSFFELLEKYNRDFARLLEGLPEMEQ